MSLRRQRPQRGENCDAKRPTPGTGGAAEPTARVSFCTSSKRALFISTQVRWERHVHCSYVFGATLWVWSLLVAYSLWVGVGLAIDLFMAGVGVVPLAMLATLSMGYGPPWVNSLLASC